MTTQVPDPNEATGLPDERFGLAKASPEELSLGTTGLEEVLDLIDPKLIIGKTPARQYAATRLRAWRDQQVAEALKKETARHVVNLAYADGFTGGEMFIHDERLLAEDRLAQLPKETPDAAKQA